MYLQVMVLLPLTLLVMTTMIYNIWSLAEEEADRELAEARADIEHLLTQALLLLVLKVIQ